MKVAAVNSWCEPLKINENLERIKKWLERLDEEGVEYALFPELCVSGYINRIDLLNKYVVEARGIMEELKSISLQHDICFSVGLPVKYSDGWDK